MGWPRLDEPFLAESGAGPGGDMVLVGNSVAHIGVFLRTLLGHIYPLWFGGATGLWAPFQRWPLKSL